MDSEPEDELLSMVKNGGSTLPGFGQSFIKPDGDFSVDDLLADFYQRHEAGKIEELKIEHRFLADEKVYDDHGTGDETWQDTYQRIAESSGLPLETVESTGQEAFSKLRDEILKASVGGRLTAYRNIIAAPFMEYRRRGQRHALRVLREYKDFFDEELHYGFRYRFIDYKAIPVPTTLIAKSIIQLLDSIHGNVKFKDCEVCGQTFLPFGRRKARCIHCSSIGAQIAFSKSLKRDPEKDKRRREQKRRSKRKGRD